MNRIAFSIYFVLMSMTAIAQRPDALDIRQIEMDTFSNDKALQMGRAIIELAKSRGHRVAVEIARLNHTVFLYVDDALPVDKHNWLRRKINVAKHFEVSSLAVRNDLQAGNMSLTKTFALDEKDFLAKGGAIPIFVKNAGMIAVIAVSGLHEEEDHRIIVEALKGKYF